MENKKIIIATLAFLTVLLSIAIPAMGQATTPTIFIDPQTYNASATGESFTVNVNVSDASGVAGYGIYMRFDPAILVVTGWHSGGFLETSGVQALGVTSANFSNIGYVSVGDTLSGPGSASGNGTLVKISFKTLGGGRCPLHLYNTNLYDENNVAISHTETDGEFAYNHISLTPSNGTAAFWIQGYGFATNSTISATWNDTAMILMPTQSDARGNFVTPAIVPDISTPGNYTIKVSDSGLPPNTKEAVFTLTAATGLQGPQGPKGDTGPQGPSGTSGSDTYIWAALALSIVAIIIGIYAAARKRS